MNPTEAQQQIDPTLRTLGNSLLRHGRYATPVAHRSTTRSARRNSSALGTDQQRKKAARRAVWSICANDWHPQAYHPRHICDSLPAGYIIGRVSTGEGPAQLIDLKTLGTAITAAGGTTGGGGGSSAADFGFFFSGKPIASAVIFEMIMSKAIILPLNLSGSKADTNTAATADYTMTLNKNGASIGTIKYPAGGGAITIVFSAAVTLSIGDKLQVVGQVAPDLTLADFFVSFAATFV